MENIGFVYTLNLINLIKLVMKGRGIEALFYVNRSFGDKLFLLLKKKISFGKTNFRNESRAFFKKEKYFPEAIDRNY